MRSACRDGVVLAPLVLCILGLALYPQLILKRTDRSVQQTVANVTAAKAEANSRRGPRSVHLPGTAREAMSTFNAPQIDYAALSPVIALTAGLCVVLLAGVFEPRQARGAGADAWSPWPRPRGC